MKRTVLIVDDHAGFHRQAAMLLVSAGFDVVGEAADGASGLEAARELAPDVVLLDVQLPDMTGFDVASLLAEDSGPAVVLISSREAADYGSRIEGSRALGFITKAELSRGTLDAILSSAHP
ncbi:MAG: response regulator [Actinomycetota bacterium]